MSKVAFIFPGQGSQYAGMGKDFYDNSETAKEVFALASKCSGLDVEHLCFEENEDLNITEYTQIAMLADEAAILKVIEEKGFKCEATAGLSLGEYGALIAAGILSLEDAFTLIRKRGIYMQEAYPEGGGMSAVLGLNGPEVEEACNKVVAELSKPVSVANFNCPGQIVITGDIDAVTAAGESLAQSGAKKVVPLKVSGPFHSELLADASSKLAEALESIELSEEKIPYVTNVTADYVTDISETKGLLAKQVCAPVRWQQSMERLVADGFDTFVEIGPGKTLAGFMKRISRDVKVINIDKFEDLAKLEEI
ncbi:MAG: ACP S-malonyltransferase [Lachnospiraceae bacterium]|nr:ACP S-malonyltransferase [Lachnospiraceae bacterium]